MYAMYVICYIVSLYYFCKLILTPYESHNYTTVEHLYMKI